MGLNAKCKSAFSIYSCCVCCAPHRQSWLWMDQTANDRGVLCSCDDDRPLHLKSSIGCCVRRETSQFHFDEMCHLNLWFICDMIERPLNMVLAGGGHSTLPYNIFDGLSKWIKLWHTCGFSFCSCFCCSKWYDWFLINDMIDACEWGNLMGYRLPFASSRKVAMMISANLCRVFFLDRFPSCCLVRVL